MKSKKCIGVLVLLVMAVTLACPALAASAPVDVQHAEYLYEHGLFKGVGVDESGNPLFALDRTAKRSEGITMFVRVLGKGGEAESGTYSTPFTDVPEWARGYVGYAYEHQLAKGTSGTAFSSEKEISGYEFLTLCLRALGYVEGADFKWDSPCDLGVQAGVIRNAFENTSAFTRGDMVIMAYNTLFAEKKDTQETFADEMDLSPAVILYGGAEIFDADDLNNRLQAADGNYYVNLKSMPEGSIAVSDSLVYTEGAGSDVNFDAFVSGMKSIDPNFELREGYKVYLATTPVAKLSVENGNWVVTVTGWSKKDARNMFVTMLNHFGGDASMASSVYGIVNEHYTNRPDNYKAFTSELASKYGLSVVSQETKHNGLTGIVTLSNGSKTWDVTYTINANKIDNMLAFEDTSVTVIIPIRSDDTAATNTTAKVDGDYYISMIDYASLAAFASLAISR